MFKKMLAFLLTVAVILSATSVGFTTYAASEGDNGELEIFSTNDCLVESVSFKPVTMFENTGGVYYGDDNGDRYYYYSWNGYLEYTIIMKDGQIIESIDGGFYYNGEWHSFIPKDDQHLNHWTVGNTYKGTVDVLGYEAEVYVTIIPSPVQSVEVKPITLVENTNGYYDSDPSGNAFYRYSLYRKLEYTVIMNDGQIIKGYGSQFEYNGEWFNVNIQDDQNSNHWVAGNTYTATFNILGCDAEVDVTIISSPVQSVEFKPITLVENSHGYYNQDENGETYFRYSWESYLEYTIILNDGTEITGNDGGFIYEGVWYSFDYQDAQYLNHWIEGNTYTATVNVLGYDAEVDVTIIPSPVRSVEVKPIKLAENTNGYYSFDPDGNSFYAYYWYRKLEYTVIMNDGQIIKGYGSQFEYNGEWFNVNIQDDQNSNHWVAGNTYTATINVQGYEAEVDVTIIPSPVKSVEIKPVTLVENTNGSNNHAPNGEIYYRYWWTGYLEYTVVMNDGQVINGCGSGFEYDNTWYSFDYQDDQYLNHWTVGNTYKGTVNVLGYETEVDVNIISSPIKSVELKPITLIENENGYYSSDINGNMYFYYWWSDSLEYTITMHDGSVISGRGTSFYFNGQQNRLEYYVDQERNPFIAGNNYTIDINVLGYNASVEVTVCARNEDDGFEYLLQDGYAIITGCNRSDFVLKIPSTVDGYTVIGITDITWGIYYTQEVIIPDTVTMISNNLFMSGNNLQKITIGAGIEVIDNQMFSNCYNLKEINISPENPMYTSIDGVVYDKDVTTVIAFPMGKTGTYTVPDTVTDISLIFENINYLDIELDLGNSKTGYKVVDGVYYNEDMTTVFMCSPNKTGTYTMPDTVTSISDCAFKNSKLSEIIISENVSDIVYSAFSFSIELEKVVLPQNLKSISSYAFYGCEKLAEADLPSGLTNLEEYAFADTGIKKANIPSGVEYVGNNAYYRSKVSKLTLAEGIKAIGAFAFSSTKVKNIVLPDSLMHLGRAAFSDTPLETVEIGSGLEGISADAFSNTKLKTVTIPENVAEIGEYAFANSPLEEAYIGYNAVYIHEGAFYKCPLKSIDLKEGEIFISDYAFYGNNATSLVLPQGVTNITYKSFAESKQLLTIDVSDKLESLCGTAFDGTAWWDAQPDGVVYLENYFYGYKGEMPEYTELTIKEGTPIIADHAFDDRANLKQINIPASVKYIGNDTFNSCFGLEKVNIDSNNEYYSTNEDGTILYNSYGYAIWKKAEAIEYVEDLRTYFYQGEKFSLASQDFDMVWVKVRYVDGTYDYESHTLNKASDVSGFDSTQPGYQTVTLSFGNLSYEYEVYVESSQCHMYSYQIVDPTCTEQGYIKCSCAICGEVYSIEYIDALGHSFGDWQIREDATCTENGEKYRVCSLCGEEETESISAHQYVNGVCSNCHVISEDYLTYTVSNDAVTITSCNISISGKAIIPSTIGGYQVAAIGDFAFSGCDELISLTIPDGVTHIGEYAFEYCSSLESIVIPEGLTSINKGVFYNCKKLNDITIPNSVTSIGDSAFCACQNLKNIIIPNGVTSIGKNAFRACNSIKNIIIPNSVTIIDDFAFYSCSKLESITLSNSITSIGTAAFDGCVNLETVYYCGTEEQWNNINIPIDSFNANLIFATRYYHNFGDWQIIKDATCTENGEKYRVCAICGEQETEIIDKTSHSYVVIGVWDSSCTEQGYTAYTCQNCGDIYKSNYTEPFGHDYVSVTTKPTCTEQGYTTYTCSNCGDSYISDYTDAEGHCYVMETTDATCTEQGYTTYTCSNCGDSYISDYTIALGHDYEKDFTIDKEPTEFEDGIKSRHCSRCDSVTDVTVIPNDSVASGNCGENANWTITKDGVLVISGSGATKNYGSKGAAPWYAYSDTITSIEIGSEITYIGHYNFRSLTNLISVKCDNPDITFSKYYVFGKSDIVFYGKGNGALEEYTVNNNYVLVKPENPNTVIDPVLLNKNANSITLVAVEGYEYSLDGENWQKSNVFDNLMPNTVYTLYQRIAEGVYAASETSNALKIKLTSIPQAPQIANISGTTVTITPVSGCEYSVDGVNWQLSNVFTNLDENKVYSAFVRNIPSEIENDPSSSLPTKFIIVSAPKIQLVGASKIVVEYIEGYEYSVDGVVWQSSNVFDELIPEFDYFVYQRYAGSSDVYSTESEGTQFITNGKDEVDSTPDASNLVDLKLALFMDSTDMSMDYNADGKINVLDLIRLKKILLGMDIPDENAANNQTESYVLVSEPAYVKVDNLGL